MKNLLIMKSANYLLILLFVSTLATAQKKKAISIAFLNAASAYPFSQFGKLLRVLNIRALR